MLTTLDLLKSQIKDARETLETTAGNIKKTHLHKDPGGKALPLGAAYAHLVFSEDAIIHGMLQGKASLYATTWKDKTGASQPLPEFDDAWSKNHESWKKSVRLDIDQFKKYAQAVYKATDTYISGLKPADLEKKVDLGSMGTYTVVQIISNFVIGHAHNLAGEISAIKGVFGTTGYPF